MSTKYRLKIIKNDGTVDYTRTSRKMQIWSKLVRDVGKEWTLTVEYQPDVLNSGTFTKLSDVRKSFTDWTDRQQLEYVNGGKW
jgi:phage tail tape-measure protein